MQNFAYPNGVTKAYSYDTLNRLTQMGSSKSSTPLSNYAHTLGASGNRKSVAELTGRTAAYAYDSLYRLTSETATADPHNNNGVGSYTYDSVGNRKTLSSTLPPQGGMTYNYDPDDRLASDQYDADGNTTLSTGIANTYDFENHLITHGGVTVLYDGDGNRVSETVAGVTTNYLVDTQNPTGYAQVVDELQSGSVTRTYAYGLERISENQQISSTWTPSFYGYDGHGSVRQLTNSAGAVTDTYDYDAFGNLINSTGSTPNNYLFAGEQYDPALGLYYNRARYLNTTTGRFWSMDPKEGRDLRPLSLHRYLYAGNNPVNLADPSGLDFDLISTVGAQDIGETLDTMENPETVLQGERNAKIAQIYWVFGLGNFGGGGKLLGFIPIPHAYVFADITGGESERFDVALDVEEGATLGSAIIGTVPGFINVEPATLAEVSADSLSKTKSASLSVLEYGMWRAGLPAIASGTNSITVGLDTVIDELPFEYQAFARGGINCITFASAASGAAKALESAPF